MVLSTSSQNRTVSGNTNEYIHVRYISSNIVPLCKYTLLPATVQVLKSFLEAIFWKPVHFYLGILNDVSSITKATSLQCRFHSRELVKSNFSVVTSFFAKKSLTKTDRCAGALSRRRILLVLYFKGRFIVTAFERRQRMSVYIPANYTRALRKILKPLQRSCATYSPMDTQSTKRIWPPTQPRHYTTRGKNTN